MASATYSMVCLRLSVLEGVLKPGYICMSNGMPHAGEPESETKFKASKEDLETVQQILIEVVLKVGCYQPPVECIRHVPSVPVSVQADTFSKLFIPPRA